MHRLSSSEYNATVRDVLGTALEPASSSWRGGELAGFDNIASVLGVDEMQYDRYFQAARALAAEVVAADDLRARFVACDLEQATCVSSSIASFGQRLFRRPLERDELASYERVYTAARMRGDDAQSALAQSVQALLSSAEFLYRIELDPEPESTEPHALGPFELATRLSYFLWSSAPDNELLARAADGSLGQSATLSAAVDRLLQDAKSRRFIDNFAGQWLGARQVPAHAARPEFYQWSPRLAVAAGEEMLLYFQDFLRSGRSWLEFPTADINYIDGYLAPFYGVPSSLTGFGTFERVEFHGDRRAGFFGLAGFLALSSYDRRTSPSRRGHWIVGNMLCAEPPPPPANVPELDQGGQGGSSPAPNIRDRLEEHRRQPECAACHALFDPYGLALEEYDAIGSYRSTYDDGTPVDATSTLPASEAQPAGSIVNGLAELSQAVASDPRLGTCLIQKLFMYALGRPLTDSDEPHLRQARAVWLDNAETPSLRRLIQAVVASDAFRFRRGGT